MKKTYRSLSFVLIVLLFLAYQLLFFKLRAPTFSSTQAMDVKNQPLAEDLKRHVAILTGYETNRSVLHPESLDAAADYIQSEFEAMGYVIEKQPLEIEGIETHNLIARLVPEKISPESPWVIVGAHYDAYGEDNPGADDNASGVAGLLELAKMFKTNQHRLTFPVEFVAYSTEEPPYFAGPQMGSAIHAKQFKQDGKDVRMMFSIEMIGYYSNELFSQHFPNRLLYLFYPWRGDFIGIIGSFDDSVNVRAIKRSFQSIDGLKSYSINGPRALRGIDFSDHRSYWDLDWPAVMITDTAFLRNLEYHKPGDTPDRLDYDMMALVVRAMYQAVNELQ